MTGGRQPAREDPSHCKVGRPRSATTAGTGRGSFRVRAGRGPRGDRPRGTGHAPHGDLGTMASVQASPGLVLARACDGGGKSMPIPGWDNSGHVPLAHTGGDCLLTSTAELREILRGSPCVKQQQATAGAGGTGLRGHDAQVAALKSEPEIHSRNSVLFIKYDTAGLTDLVVPGEPIRKG